MLTEYREHATQKSANRELIPGLILKIIDPSGMKRTSNLIVLALTLAPCIASDPLKVTAVVSPKPYFAGQGVEVRVEVDPGSGSPTIEPPRVKDAEVFPMSSDPSRFVIVPGHAGPLDLPAFRARSGDRSGASKPTRLVVASLPAEGRTSAFLGGIGSFEVKAEAEPLSVRPGDTLEFRVKLVGPAAWGSVRAPDLSEWSSPTLKLEADGDRLEASETPVRTFLYRVRPLKAGPITLPPIAIAAFDPTTRRYATRATSSLTIRVAEPPRFDPSRLDYPPAGTPARGSHPISLILGALALVSGSVLAAWFATRRRRRSRVSDPRLLALELSKGLQGGDDEVEAARAVSEALTTFLQRVAGRAPGVLTPPEARAGFQRLTRNLTLSSRAEALVTRCDRARYGVSGSEASGMIEEGRRFFEGVAEWNWEGPGEAVETASDA
jgi:hypothetical protein